MLVASLLPTCKANSGINPNSADDWGENGWEEDSWDDEDWDEGDEWGEDEWGEDERRKVSAKRKIEIKKNLAALEISENDLPSGPLNLAQARQYAIILVNRDRIKNGLKLVVYDDIATQAGQRHAINMGTNGITGHLGAADGSVPEERLTDAGGEDKGSENSSCIIGGGKKYKIDPDPEFSKAMIEELEEGLMNSPGHRRTILTPMYNGLGIGLVKLSDFDMACMAQEFVADYGTYGKLPKTVSVGDQITVSGELKAPAKFFAVGLARIDLAAPISYEELIKKHSYPTPKPYIWFYQKGFVTPKPVTVQGNRFSIDLTLNDKQRPGRYEVSVWGRPTEKSDPKMISLRTIEVR